MTTGLILLAGMLTLGGAVMVVAALVPAPPGLQPALDRFGADTSPADGPRLDVAPTSRSERLGAALYRRSPVALTARQRQLLRLQNKPIAEFYADKLVMAVVGAILPAVVGFGWGWMTGSPS